jgi:hypothetical protein
MSRKRTEKGVYRIPERISLRAGEFINTKGWEGSKALDKHRCCK